MDDFVKRSAMESSSTLFEKVVSVKITKSGFEDRHMDLTIRFIMGVSKMHRTTKVLQVQITSESDPFFFYSLDVNEDDFQTLKVDQCILVDFVTFPYKFIELLEQCIASGCNESPRFLANLSLRTGDAVFSIVETNQFKHLSHISLCFRQGNDSTIKSYLAGRLSEFKTINLDLHDKLRRTLLSLEKALSDVDTLNSEVAELKEQRSRCVNELKVEYALEIAHEREKVMQETAELKERFERERMEVESRLRQQAETQQERAIELDNQVRTLLDTKYKLDSKISELRTKFVAVEKDLDEKQQECERLRRENRTLDSEKHENTKQLNRHLIRLSALEQEVQDKNDLVANLTMQLENQGSHRSALEASWKEAQAAADRAEERANVSAAEITKCYNIIEKLQLELRSMKNKVKHKGQVTSQQDTLLQEKQSAIDKGLNEIHSLRHEVDHLKTDNEGLTKKTEDLQRKLDEAQELVKSNQQMIQWLNQQLTDAQLGKLGAGGGGVVSSRYHHFRPPNGLTSFTANNTLVSSRSMADANGSGTSFSSTNSIAGNSSPTPGAAAAFKPTMMLPSGHSFSTGVPYNLSSGGAFGSSSSVHLKSNTNTNGSLRSSAAAALPNSFATTAGSRPPCCIAKAAGAAATAGGIMPSASSATSKVQYRPSHLAKMAATTTNGGGGGGGGAIPLSGEACAASSPSSQCSFGDTTVGPTSWQDDTSFSWISKLGGVVLPRPQLSFAEGRSSSFSMAGAGGGGGSAAAGGSGGGGGGAKSMTGSGYLRSAVAGGSGLADRSQPQSPQLQSPPPQSPGQQPGRTRACSPRPRSPARISIPHIQSPRTLSPTVKIR